MTTETTPSPDAAPARRCQNCGEALLGEHCYACGQPTKGLVRHFSSIIGDFMDSVFELDSRILRTLGPLLFRPGYLSDEYFAGRRVRYVSPVRLFVFLSLFAFFAAQLSFQIDNTPRDAAEVRLGDEGDVVNEGFGERMLAADTVAKVEQIRDEALAEVTAARDESKGVPGVSIGLDIAEKAVKNEADRRIEEIRESERTGKPLPVTREDTGTISFNGTPWDREKNPLVIGWLGESGNARLNGYVDRAQGNIKRIQDDPNLLKDAFLSTVPTTLFVLLPLFAALLKVAYVFKGRLYMEHLIVALHSHSFLCAGLLLVLLLDAMAGWASGLGWLPASIRIAEVALVCWMPVYLLLMQKRVYRQGWIMTLLKYTLLGTCYLVLLSFGATASLLASLVNL
ncbi:DUF3667 domain-containing protein [Arenimonas metalli]|uniref:DUF3667 domain-containing protein n=1 Tax=Arenimonas metalli CF5-1 TaxID=1384056 RepID=A0A091B4P4_9GAMM|nr:DUF3667 domain-containing protein [Arenimonas metalli]KFN46696.1 hypothetical protein N787_09855 [Arenimonas metalli CF5-1]